MHGTTTVHRRAFQMFSISTSPRDWKVFNFHLGTSTIMSRKEFVFLLIWCATHFDRKPASFIRAKVISVKTLLAFINHVWKTIITTYSAPNASTNGNGNGNFSHASSSFDDSIPHDSYQTDVRSRKLFLFFGMVGMVNGVIELVLFRSSPKVIIHKFRADKNFEASNFTPATSTMKIFDKWFR